MRMMRRTVRLPLFHFRLLAMALTQTEQIKTQFEKAQRILITFSKNFNADAISGSLALFLFLKHLGKDVTILCEDFYRPKTLEFLPQIDKIMGKSDELSQFVISLDLTHTKVKEFSYDTEGERLRIFITPEDGEFTEADVEIKNQAHAAYDLIITIGTQDLESLGTFFDERAESFYETPILNIDNRSSNEGYGQINVLDLTAVSITEILYRLFKELDSSYMHKDLATLLLTGMITRTKSFKTSVVTPHALRVASELVEQGGAREEIVKNIYQSHSLNTLKLWGRVLARLKSRVDNQLVWSLISQEDFNLADASAENFEGMTDELIVSAPQARVIVLLFEKEDTGVIQVWIRAVKNVDALALAAQLGATGSRAFAEVTLDHTDLKTAEARVIRTLQEAMEKMVA
ncbi:MAG: hypothetical protein AUK21_03505 [Parcubacteria group bacterium CG2_30_48_51]|nr:MAG: hypothetical protein AUK21_03505 [Parcubacteria group bacterium CG2_30_48_51]